MKKPVSTKTETGGTSASFCWMVATSCWILPTSRRASRGLADEEAEVDHALLDVQERCRGLDVDGRVGRSLDPGDVELVGRLRRHEEVRLQADRLVDVDRAGPADDLRRLRLRDLDPGGHADEPVACAEGSDQLGRARDRAPRSAAHALVENCRLVARTLDGDRIRLRQRAQGLAALAAARAGQSGKEKGAGQEPGETHDRHYSTCMRFFSEQEANDALGVVAPLVERLVAARGRFVADGQRLARLKRKVTGNGGGLDPARAQEVQSAVEEVANEIGLLVAELESAGVQVEGPRPRARATSRPATPKAAISCCSAGISGRTGWPSGTASKRASRAGSRFRSENSRS